MTYATLLDNLEKLPARSFVMAKGESFIAFLAMNNIHGYLNEPEYLLDPYRINDILLATAVSDSLTAAEFKARTFAIRYLTRQSVGTSAAMELLARAMGYRTYGLANFCRYPDGHIENVWEGSMGSATEPVSLEDETLTRQFRNYRDNPRIRELYTLHNAFNREKSAAKKARFQERKAEREQRRDAQSQQ